jgi:tetratricopeptide (TPR) repeat protein
MKKELWFALILLASAVLPAPAQQAADLKAAAYELYQAKRFDEAARSFQAYLEKNPGDAVATIDYASLLSELQRHQEAANVLETIRKKTPQNETAAFKLAVEYAALKRYADADKLFAELEKSSNPALAIAAAEAAKRSKEDQQREEKLSQEQRVYDLANQFKYQEVVDAVNALEQKESLSFGMQMQRLYALHSLHQYATALKGADLLAVRHPDDSDLALLRAELLAQLGRRPEAEVIWRRLGRQSPGTPAGVEAGRRLGNLRGTPPEARIYELARQRKHRDVIAAIGELEAKGPLSFQMQMQRLYAYQALGQSKAALEQLDKITAPHSNSTELAFFRSDLLVQQHRWQEASKILKQLKSESGEWKTVLEAERRLDAIPPIANLDKHFWGEAYLSGDYLGRFGTVVGSGFIRQGAFIPHARWLQPYAEMRFGVDTRSGVAGERTIVTDNHLGLYGGIRAQLLPTEYLFVYAQAGGDIDLLERRQHGDFSYDSQAGIYGFKSWGPGKVLFRSPPGWQSPPDRPDSFAAETHWRDKNLGDLFFWRGDWFVDGGADFSYYHRYSSWIGYGQAHEGFRLFQLGPNLGFDAYAVENISWDVRGRYFDNLFEVGPGARLLWLPHRGWEVVLRTEWLNGFYLGRGRSAFAVAPRSHYDEVRVGLSVGVRW